MKNRLFAASAVAALITLPASAELIDVQVTVENLSPNAGTYMAPMWLGFHDGSYSVYENGMAASAGLEVLAEDGSPMALNTEFMMAGGAMSGTLAPGGPFAPGDIASMMFTIDTDNLAHRRFSFASMIVPSNDAFIANSMAAEIVDSNGNFLGFDHFVNGGDILDAGTEVNDEVPENTAFFGQSMPNTGVTENGVVGPHAGYLGSAGNPGTASILADPMFSGADFTLDGYPVARITITAVPAPGAFALLGLAGLAGRRRRRDA